MTKEEAERIVENILVEEGDLVVCPNCDGLHDAQPISRNGSGLQMMLRCGDKIIELR